MGPQNEKQKSLHSRLQQKQRFYLFTARSSFESLVLRKAGWKLHLSKKKSLFPPRKSVSHIAFHRHNSELKNEAIIDIYWCRIIFLSLERAFQDAFREIAHGCCGHEAILIALCDAFQFFRCSKRSATC